MLRYKTMKNQIITLPRLNRALLLLGGAALIFPALSQAVILNANLGGTFTMNMDSAAQAALNGGNASDPGMFLVQYYDAASSNYVTDSDTELYTSNDSRTPIPPVNLVHAITPIAGENPPNQAPGRNVISTTPDFSVDSATLAGTGTLGMTGVELYRGVFSGSLLIGDYSLQYNPAARAGIWSELGVSGDPSGWYLQNNITFSSVVYDLSSLTLSYSDSQNWSMSGNLLLSPDSAAFLDGAALTQLGSFCLGFGADSNCGDTAFALPLPAPILLFASGMALVFASIRRPK